MLLRVWRKGLKIPFADLKQDKVSLGKVRSPPAGEDLFLAETKGRQ